MKVILAIVIAIVVALVAINYFTTGEISLMPPGSEGSGEGQVNHLRGEFTKLARDYRQAQKQAAVAGLDTTEDAAATLAELDHVQDEVTDIALNAPEVETRNKAKALLEEIKQYKRDIE